MGVNKYPDFVSRVMYGDRGKATNPSVEDIERHLKRYLPELAVVTSDHIDRGMNSLYRLVVDNYRPSELVLKLFTHKTESKYARREAAIYQHISRETAVPVPSVVATDFAPESFPPWVLMEKLHGESYEGRADRLPTDTLDSIVSEAGRYLGELHASVQFDSFGELEVTGERLASDGSHDTWADQFDAFVAERIEGASKGQFSDLLPDVRDFLVSHCHLLEAVEVPVLVHDDYRIGNMLVDVDDPNSSVTAILDWERAMPGHHEYDLVRAEYMLIDQQFDDEQVCERLRTALYDGYRESFEFTRCDAFERRRDIYRAATILLLMWAFPVIWDDYPESRKERESELLTEHLEAALR